MTFPASIPVQPPVSLLFQNRWAILGLFYFVLNTVLILTRPQLVGENFNPGEISHPCRLPDGDGSSLCASVGAATGCGILGSSGDVGALQEELSCPGARLSPFPEQQGKQHSHFCPGSHTNYRAIAFLI